MKTRVLILALALLLPAAEASAAPAGCTLSKVAELPVVMRGLRPTVPAKINGIEGKFLFDSGSSFSILNPASVPRFGLRETPSSLVVSGAGGRSRVRIATARDMVFGGATYQRPDFLISEKGLGEGVAGLLGANMVARADVEYDLANGVIRLFRAEGCKEASLAYWAGDKPFSVIDIENLIADAHIRGVASVNGVKMQVMFDTGASTSMIDLHAAERAGVTPTTAGVINGGASSGVGLRSYVQDWIGPFASFKIGGEEIKNTRLRFGDIDLEDNVGMLVGADFFLSHRVYVSHSQHKLYFTYNGGPVFNLGVAPQRAVAATPAGPAPTSNAAPSTPAKDDYSNAPTDAAGFGRRAAAEEARRDFPAAIDDLTKAIALEPTSADYVYRRAMARLANHQVVLAVLDFDQVLKLRPDDIPALLTRAEIRAAARNLDGAKQDLATADKLADKEPGRRIAVAIAYQRAGLWSESIGPLDQWIPAYPRSDNLPLAQNARCLARAMLGQDLDKALADCDAALRALPGQPGFLDSRALVYLRRGEFDRGIADYQAVLKLQPNNAWALYGRGWARLKKGQKEAGDADIKAAIALRPRLADEAKARGLAL
jgi:tetratricopeptide (TPR) repeat protein